MAGCDPWLSITFPSTSTTSRPRSASTATFSASRSEPTGPTSPSAGAWLDAGGQQIHLIEGKPPPGLGQHFALLVDDLEATVTELRARGTEVSDPKPVGSSRQAFVTDPAGNLVEMHQAWATPAI